MKIFQCCLLTKDPGKWTAGEDNTADQPMVKVMHNIVDRLSYRMPLDDFIWALKASVNIDSRTMLGGNIQRCLLSNAAHRLEILAKQIDPEVLWKTSRERLRDAWAVYRGEAVVIYVKE